MDAVLRRSLLFVPGNEPRHLARARDAGADTLVFDLEDAVAPEAKTEARAQVAATLRAGGFGGAEPAVRINAPGTPYCDADLEAVVGAGAAALLVPKAEHAADLARLAERLRGLERASGRPLDGVRLLALVETAAGIAGAAAVAAATPRLAALCFGHADLARDLRLPEADPSRGVLYHARCALVLAAAAAGVPAIDCVSLAVRDDAATRADATLGRELGFAGKLCIHPQQVAVVNEVYTPTAAQIARARRVVAAWRAARREGRAVFALDGVMVDAPLVAAEEQVLERARRAGALATDIEEETA